MENPSILRYKNCLKAAKALIKLKLVRSKDLEQMALYLYRKHYQGRG